MLNNSSYFLKARIATCASIAVLLTACGGGSGGDASALTSKDQSTTTASATADSASGSMLLAETTTSITYLAQNAVRTGNVILSAASPGLLGTGYATRFWAANDSITFTVNAATAGDYDIGVRYQNANTADQTLTMYINGVKLRQVKMAKLADWNTWAVKTERMALKAGSNTIEFQRDSVDNGSVNLNNIVMTKVASTTTTSPAPTTTTTITNTVGIANTSKHLYVATTGSDTNPGTLAAPFKTIQKASQVAVADTTVHVAAGTYTGNISSSASGTATARIYFVSDKKWGAKIVPAASGSSSIAWTVSGNYVTINGFDIDGTNVSTSGAKWRIGVLTRSSNVSVDNNHIHHIANTSADCTSDGGGGIVGDSYYGGLNITMDRNLVHNLGPTTACTYFHGLYMSTSGTISNNIIYKVGYGGVHLWHDANRVNIVNNTIFDTPKAIIVGTGQRYKLTSPGDYINVANNILIDNKYGIIEESDGSGNGANNYYVNNLYYRNTYNEAINSYNKPHISGSVTADPMFVNYQISGGGDYRVKSGSPAINSGSATYAPSIDFDGKARASTSADDRGAFEF